MTAQLIDNPFSFGSADTSATVVFPAKDHLKITQIEFVGYQNATDQCEIQNADGDTVWYGDGKADLDTVRSGKIGWIKGLKIPTNVSTEYGAGVNIPSGKVLIYFE